MIVFLHDFFTEQVEDADISMIIGVVVAVAVVVIIAILVAIVFWKRRSKQ